MRSLLPCYKGLLAFRLRSALKFIFRNVSLMLFATPQEGKKQHAEDATPLNTPDYSRRMLFEA